MQEKKQKAKQFWDAFNNADMDSALALLTEDAVFTVSGTTPVSGKLSGKNTIRGHMKLFADQLEPGARMEVREMIGEGDVVVCLTEGTMRAKNGRDYNNSYAFVFRFRDGQITSITEYLDTALVETALCGRTIS